MIRHYNILVKGKVQGVSYRFSAQAVANKFHLNGFVKNLPGGEVYIEAEGNEDSINQFLNWCYVGPPKAEVEEVSATESELKHFTAFEIKR